MLEVTVGLEPTKASFAGWCLDRFGIATKLVYPKTYTQVCTQIAPLAPIDA
jgi:predicted 3-demethylubiquinone-9 3-methyltransferase (glyoxalase superfamily)